MSATDTPPADGSGRTSPRRPRWNIDERCRQFPILAALRERVLVFDGAMGTMIHAADLTIDDYRGKENCVELINETRPDVIAAIHAAYFEAGADIVETNTFGSMPMVLVEFGIADRAYDLSKKAAEVARGVARDFSSRGRPRWVAGSVGPTTKMPSLGHIRFDEQMQSYATQMHGLLDGGVDLIQIETQIDILNVKAAVVAAHEAFRRAGREVPIIAQVTIETTGAMLVGTEIAAALPVLEALDVDVVGLNCATGPDLMQEHVRFLGKHASRFVSVLPNAGLPRNVGGVATFDLKPEELATFHERFVREYGVSLVGGCCGTTPEHIRAIAERVKGLVPLPRPAPQPTQVASLYSAVTLSQDPPPLIVGERTNANGSKKFKELLLREDWEGMVEMAKEAAGEGAHVLDVCTAYVGRPEARDMNEVLKRFATQVTLPLMIDTTQLDVLEAALKLVGGRAIINSINLEDGEPKADRICALARTYGACLVALTIDENGMAKTAAAKVAVAQRIYDIVVGRHGLPPDSILFDPLTFTIASGDEDSRKAGLETLDAIAAIKKQMPGVRTLLGLSNISFGLKPYPRQVLNSVYLAEAIERGLDAAILNQAKIIPLSNLDEAALEVTRDLIYDRRREGYDPLFAFIARFDTATGTATTNANDESLLPIEEQLKQRIIGGKKPGIGALLDVALTQYKPLEIINNILLEGMKVVGELFGSGRMQLPFVLQSAETMKAAVAHLEPAIRADKVANVEKGVIVLGTVKGDVHDIGKNLVDIILSNNGYKVENLGIKVQLEVMLEAAERLKADAIGMSGLLVKSTVVMKENLELMAQRGYTIPVICGGAALNRGYVEGDLQDSYSTGEVYYGIDAFTGMSLMEELCGHREPRVLTGPGRKRMRRKVAAPDRGGSTRGLVTDYAPSDVKPAAQIPKPPFWGSRVMPPSELSLAEIFAYINKRALFRGQWQYRRGRRGEEEYRHFVAAVVEPKFKSWCQRAIDHRMLEPQLVYGYFPCNADKNELVIYDPVQPSRELRRISFPRQTDGRRLCIADFFRNVESGERDVVGLQIVTMGHVASEKSNELFKADLYDDYLHFHGLAVESAEALAEMWHRRTRQDWNIAGVDAKTTESLFTQGYQGSRYSFGYPACPRLEDQEHIFQLLDAGRIGLELTEEFELVPEQSTSAIIVHHPEARYFNVG